MSCDKWAYYPDKCDGHDCPGDCDLCELADEEWLDEETEKEIEQEIQEILAARKGEE